MVANNNVTAPRAISSWAVLYALSPAMAGPPLTVRIRAQRTIVEESRSAPRSRAYVRSVIWSRRVRRHLSFAMEEPSLGDRFHFVYYKIVVCAEQGPIFSIISASGFL